FVTTAACGATILWVSEDGGHGRVFEGVGAYFKRSWRILREEAEVRRFLLANAAWEGTFAAARTCDVLYGIVWLHSSVAISAPLRAGRGGRDRPRTSVHALDRRLPDSLAGLRPPDPGRDPARRAHDARRARRQDRADGRLMSGWERLRGLEFVMDSFQTERRS